MKQQYDVMRKSFSSALVGAGLFAILWMGASCVWAEAGRTDAFDSTRAQKIKALVAQRDRIQQELNRLQQQPEGMAQSKIQRSELSDQPTRTMKESMESLPGVVVSPAPDGNFSIRGIGK